MCLFVCVNVIVGMRACVCVCVSVNVIAGVNSALSGHNGISDGQGSKAAGPIFSFNENKIPISLLSFSRSPFLSFHLFSIIDSNSCFVEKET